jgi:hypothetical protein
MRQSLHLRGVAICMLSWAVMCAPLVACRRPRGGVSDHVHLRVGLRATHCLSDVVRELKSVSSRWVHETPGFGRFAWQEGYGAFPASQPQRVTLRRYIGEPGGAPS